MRGAQETAAQESVKAELIAQDATEAQVEALWDKLQAQSAELQTTDPQGAISRYQQFFDGGASRFPGVGVQVVLRVARIYQADLKDYDKAIEAYDTGLSLYKDGPGAIVLQKGRLAALEAQKSKKAGDQIDFPFARRAQIYSETDASLYS